MPNFNLDDYVTVNERLEMFRKDHPLWGLEASIKFDGNAVLARAVITDETGRLIACGHAEEIRDVSPVNKTSAVENCETSAWGRALANLGYEVKRGVASREEMEKVARAGRRTQRKAADPPVDSGPVLKPWQAIAAVAQKFGISDEDRHAVMMAIAGKEHSRDLSVDEVTDVMRNIRWLHDGFVQLEVRDGKPVLVDSRPSNPGPGPGQRVDG